MKTHTTLTIDADVLEKAKQLGINLSGAFNEYLIQLTNKETTVKNIDKKLLEEKEKKLRVKSSELLSELHSIQKDLRNIKESEENLKIAKLEEDKKKAEDAVRCNNCGFIKEKIAVSNDKGNICRTCYLTSSDSPKVKEVMGLK